MPTFPGPSGLVLQLKPLSGTSIVTLGRQASSQSDDNFGEVFTQSFEAVRDPGPYPFVTEGSSRPDWGRVLKGDLIGALFFVRRISMPRGEFYDFPVRCGDCGKRYDWQINLETDLPKQNLPEESKRALRNSESLRTTLHDGTSVLYSLQTFNQDKKLREHMKTTQRPEEQPTMVDRLFVQIDRLGDIPMQDGRKLWRKLCALEMPQLIDLREAFDAADCGVETLIATRHGGRCGWEQEIDLPLDRNSFLAMKRAGRKPSAPSSDSTESSSTDSSDFIETAESSTP